MPDTELQASVAICTWNRARLLEKTLSQLQRLVIPAGTAWELIVVNNNCTDDTDAVIARHQSALPLHRVFEPEPGLSRARNRALACARGALVVWTDDDVLVEPGWLTSYLEAASCHPEVSIFGGPVLPWFEVEPPPWVVHNVGRLEGPFALTDPGAAVRQPVGANMAFRRETLRSERFDPELGRIGTALMSGDETALIERLEAAGHRSMYVRSAVVRHFVPAARMTSKYVWDWFYNAGRTRARMQSDPAAAAMVAGAPRWMWRAWAQHRLELVVRSTRKDGRWLRALEMAARYQGQIAEMRAGRQGP